MVVVVAVAAVAVAAAAAVAVVVVGVGVMLLSIVPLCPHNADKITHWVLTTLIRYWGFVETKIIKDSIDQPN